MKSRCKFSKQASIEIALQILQTGGVLEELLPMLFLVAKNTRLGEKIRKKARQLVELHAPENVRKTLSVRLDCFSTYKEDLVVEQIRQIAKNTGFDVLVITHYIYKHTFLGATLLLQELPNKADRAQLVQELLLRQPDYIFKQTYFKNPIEIFDYQEIQHLELANMNLTEFPKELLKFKNLTYLNLLWNPLTTLPVEIQQLTRLEKLDLSYTKLTAFPEALYQMTQLKTVICTSTPFTRKKNPVLPLDIYTMSHPPSIFIRP